MKELKNNKVLARLAQKLCWDVRRSSGMEHYSGSFAVAKKVVKTKSGYTVTVKYGVQSDVDDRTYTENHKITNQMYEQEYDGITCTRCREGIVMHFVCGNADLSKNMDNIDVPEDGKILYALIQCGCDNDGDRCHVTAEDLAKLQPMIEKWDIDPQEETDEYFLSRIASKDVGDGGN